MLTKPSIRPRIPRLRKSLRASLKDGVYKLVIGRTTKMDGQVVGKAMGLRDGPYLSYDEGPDVIREVLAVRHRVARRRLDPGHHVL
jgi:hypothetical protein